MIADLKCKAEKCFESTFFLFVFVIFVYLDSKGRCWSEKLVFSADLVEAEASFFPFAEDRK